MAHRTPSETAQTAWVQSIPCQQRWEDMVGTDTVRHCAQCALPVYNMATLSEHEQHAVIQQAAHASHRTCVVYAPKVSGWFFKLGGAALMRLPAGHALLMALLLSWSGLSGCATSSTNTSPLAQTPEASSIPQSPQSLDALSAESARQQASQNNAHQRELFQSDCGQLLYVPRIITDSETCKDEIGQPVRFNDWVKHHERELFPEAAPQNNH